MQSFRTLRGFLNGEEPDEPDYFACSATLRILGDDLDLDEITSRIGVDPTRTHFRGEKPGPRSPGFKRDMWSYSPAIEEERPLEEHINALWADIRPARDYLMSLKEIATVDIFLSYRSNIDHAGVEVPHTSLEIFACLEVPFGISIIIT